MKLFHWFKSICVRFVQAQIEATDQQIHNLRMEVQILHWQCRGAQTEVCRIQNLHDRRLQLESLNRLLAAHESALDRQAGVV